MNSYPVYPLYTYPLYNTTTEVDKELHNTITKDTDNPCVVLPQVMWLSRCKVSIVSNISGIESEDMNVLNLFNSGRDDFYWEYSGGSPFCIKTPATSEILKNHYLGVQTLGFSPFINSTDIMFCAMDFDAHTSEELTPEENQALIVQAQEESLKVYKILKAMNLPVILNSSGSKGRHVRLFCPGAKAKDMRIFLKWILEQATGNPEKHEVFPKQDDLNEERPYGNQIKGLYAIHPKHKKRANIIVDGKELDLFDGVKYVKKLLEGLEKYSRIEMPEEKYKEMSEQQTKFVEKLRHLKANNMFYSDLHEVPQYCPVIEKLLTKVCVPSAGKYNRHACLDPNIASYGLTHPTARQEYQRVQGRNSNTAFDNWKKYWGDTPQFKCKQIMAYLNHWSKQNEYCLDGLHLCAKCPMLEKIRVDKDKPRGYANTFIISEIAKDEHLEKCPKCQTPFTFEDNKGLFYCKTCKVGGSIKKFIQVVLWKKKQQEINPHA